MLSLHTGEDETEQLLCIMEIMGPPPSYLVEAASRRKIFFDANGHPNIVPNSRGKYEMLWHSYINVIVEYLAQYQRKAWVMNGCYGVLIAGKIRQPGSKSLWGVLRCQDPGFVDLLEKCLRWNPAERITPEQALAHPWMQEQMAASPNSYRSVLAACVF